MALFSVLTMALAQTPAPPTVIRIDVNLVQVDAVVTDSHGKRVSDLKAADFIVLQDGKPQEITNFSYVSAPATARSAAPPKLAKGETPPPPPVLEPEEVHRTLALVVDDLGLAGENIPTVRNTIRKFLDNDMRPGDLVAIVRTGAGMGALQQFTTDKKLLYAALDRVKYGQSRVGMSSFTPLGRGGGRGQATMNHFREDSLAVGSLGALRFVVNEMRGYPGRKSVVLFTENIRMIYRGATDEMVTAAVQELADAANRASVVIHAIDPRGLPNVNLTAEDNTTGVSSRRASRVPQQREQQVIDTEQGMFELAEQTGGLFLHGVNDLAGSLRQIAEDSDSYYLIGYRPDAKTFESSDGQSRFHKIEVKLKRSGLHVRSREGFFGQPGAEHQTLDHTREAELERAMLSPAASGTLRPRLTAVFSNLQQTGSVIDAMLAFNPKELKWSNEADGTRKASIDIAAVAFDEDGTALATVDTTFSLQLDAPKYEAAVKTGLVYDMEVPVTKPGPYLIRAALRDPATEGTGAAQQFVEVPDVEPGHLALSGIILRDPAMPPMANPPAGQALHADASAGGAQRVFRAGTQLTYGFEVINAQMNGEKHPELELETRMFHDGTAMQSNKTTLNGGNASDPQRLLASGRVQLGKELTPGVYVLQVVVTDKLSKKGATVTQSMDFEIR
jgi:VWFA-related protein